MGSNNRIEGQVAEIAGGAARLSGDGWSLWGDTRGAARSALKAGSPATGMIRLERVRVADGPGDNHVRLPLVTSMFLGDRWEHLFHLGASRLRAYGNAPLAEGEHWLEIPRADFWVF